MREKTILENGGTLKSVPDCYKNQEMCNKAVDNHPHALEFVPQCYKTQRMFDKPVDTHSSTIKFVSDAVNRCFLYLILLLINIKLKQCVTELFLKILFE